MKQTIKIEQTVNGAKLFTARVAEEAIVAACLKRANHVFAFCAGFLSCLIEKLLCHRRLASLLSKLS
jgi:hypothetical protein